MTFSRMVNQHMDLDVHFQNQSSENSNKERYATIRYTPSARAFITASAEANVVNLNEVQPLHKLLLLKETVSMYKNVEEYKDKRNSKISKEDKSCLNNTPQTKIKG